MPIYSLANYKLNTYKNSPNEAFKDLYLIRPSKDTLIHDYLCNTVVEVLLHRQGYK